MINSGYSAMSSFNNFTDIAGLGSVFQSYMSGGAKNKRVKGKRSKMKGRKTRTKRVKKTPLRKPLSKKIRKMSKMRIRHAKQLTKREKKLIKRLKHRKARNDVINSLVSSSPLTEETVNSLTPSMKKFISNIPKDSSGTTSLTSWPSVSFKGPRPFSSNSLKSYSLKSYSLQDSKPSKLSKSSRQKKFEDARKGLADLLKKKPVYDQSKSVIKFSDYKSKKPDKEKTALKAKSKKKGQIR